MTFLKQLRAVKKGLIRKNFDPNEYYSARPHCVIGELALVNNVPHGGSMEATFQLARRMFVQPDYRVLNEGGSKLSYSKAHAILNRAIKRYTKGGR